MNARHSRYVAQIMIALLLALLVAIPATPALANGDDEGRVVFGEDVTVEAGEELEGDLVVFGGDVLVKEGGRVDGDAAVIGGNVTVSGEVDGDLVAIGGNVELTSTAVIGGDLVAIGGRFEREEGAVVRGQVVRSLRFGFRFRGIAPLRPPLAIERWGDVAWRLFYRFLSALITVLTLTALGLLVVLFLPRQTQVVGQAILAAPLPALGVGLLTGIVALALMVLLAITICLSPIAFLVGVATFAAGLFGWIAAGLLVGERVMEALNGFALEGLPLSVSRSAQARRVREPVPLVAAAIGVLLISLLAMVPCIGWLLALFLGLLGLGAVVLTRFGTIAYPAPTPPQPPATPQPAVEEPAKGDAS